MRPGGWPRRGTGESGQGLVEFSIAITIFLLLVMGTIDLGRAVYQFNGVSQVAGELARVASVHPGGTLGTSSEASSTLAAHAGLVPGLGTPSYACIDIAGAAVRGLCNGGNWVRVTISWSFIPVTPLAGLLGTVAFDQLGERKDRMMLRRGAINHAREGTRAPAEEARPKGQILAVFALSLITLLGFAGLALDGGSTFAQRRGQQTAADLAALAAANDYLINGNSAAATTRARTMTQGNGFKHASGGTTVSTSLDTSNGIAYTVTIDSPHHNALASLLGMPTWMVTTTATALAGFPDTAYGASPFIFPVSAFASDGDGPVPDADQLRRDQRRHSRKPVDFAWTNYGTGNLDTTKVDQIIQGTLTIDKTIQFGEYIGQKNQGNHNFLYADVNSDLSGQDMPAAIVDPSGLFMGWATFHVISAAGGSEKHVYGYFQASYESSRLSISSCSANDCPRYLGTYVLKLSN